MQLKKWSWALCVLQWLIYGVCVIDGICIARGLTFLGMLVVWLLLWRGNSIAYEAALYLLLLVSVPLPSCSVMFLPILGWALLLVGAWMLDRRWSRLPPTR